MKILVLGGTVFVGRAFIESALERGHTITMFNRGKSNPELFPEVEKLSGDRREDLSALDGRRWDAVLDTCGYLPREVRLSAQKLASAVDHYTFISSISVYQDFFTPGIAEDYPTGTLADPETEDIWANYGPLKFLCEQAAEAAMPGRVLHVRPGLIVGRYDRTDRFTYWPHRVALGGEVLAPGEPSTPTQFIDVRDLMDWTLRMIETGQTGVYNATGPDYALGMGEFLETCVKTTGSGARLTWTSEEFLAANEVQPWTDLPAWMALSSPEEPALMKVDCRKAFAAGLTFRSLADTIQDTLRWDATRPAEYKLRFGLTAEREADLLRKWHNR